MAKLGLFDSLSFLSPEIKYRKQPFYCPAKPGISEYASGWKVQCTVLTASFILCLLNGNDIT